MTIFQTYYTLTTGWVNCKQPNEIDYGTLFCPSMPDCRKLITKRPTKKLNLTNASLFDLLPTDILADVDTCIYGLNYCDI